MPVDHTISELIGNTVNTSLAYIPTEDAERCNGTLAQINSTSGILKQRIRELARLRCWFPFSWIKASVSHVTSARKHRPRKRGTVSKLSIPPSITTPGSVDTPIGTLKFFDGFPDYATVQKVYGDHSKQGLERSLAPLRSTAAMVRQDMEVR